MTSEVTRRCVRVDLAIRQENDCRGGLCLTVVVSSPLDSGTAGRDQCQDEWVGVKQMELKCEEKSVVL